MKRLGILVAGVVLALLGSRLLLSNVTASGTLVILMRDPPAGWGPATAVYISCSDILIHRGDTGDEAGWLNTGVSVTNLSLREVVIFKTMIGETALPVGVYNILRFNVTQAIATVNGKNYSCRVTSGKLHVSIASGGVRITGGQVSRLEIDITPTLMGKDGHFSLKPVARATPTQ